MNLPLFTLHAVMLLLVNASLIIIIYTCDSNIFTVCIHIIHIVRFLLMSLLFLTLQLCNFISMLVLYIRNVTYVATYCNVYCDNTHYYNYSQ